MSRAPRNWSPPEPHRQANRRYLQPCTTIARQPHAPGDTGAITFAPGATLPNADEARDAVPVASGRR